ncbi:MAG: thiol peroxidase [Methylococcales bacterium]|nr:thiol peroxidase [Methylococcales bacterium]MDD5755237.1 thiol peroxidase [Methylococcales bacterium]
MATITFQASPVQTCGELPAVGSDAPDFLLANIELEDVSLSNYAGKRKILNIVPSLDTPTCAASARKFNQKAATLENTVILVISADLPFAQCRFCEIEGLQDVVALSTFRSTFATDYGVQIIDGALTGVTARAVVIIDEHNKILYTQLVPELAHEPDYEAVFTALKFG